MNEIDIARVCHEVNRAYCEATGDPSQLPWNEAAQWQQHSAVMGVRYRLENMEATPADQHEAWLKDKIAGGWVYGPVKNESLKTHPALLPYAQLPEEQKVKDHLFGAVVKAMAPMLATTGVRSARMV